MQESLPSWQNILSQGFTHASQLLNFLQLPLSSGCDAAEKQFKTRVPRGFAAKMEVGNPQDPLLLQVLAVAEELNDAGDFVSDPLSEIASNPIPGLIHKYHGRVLLTLTGACAINCRYCFRRHFPYQDNNPGRHGWQPVIDYINQDKQIHEVILSGGDPLLARDEILAPLLAQVASIPHVSTLRIHTRIPVVLPERVDESLLKILINNNLQKVIVLHSNHAAELDYQVAAVCKRLDNAGCHLLNQSVLLAGVNDDADTLAKLSRRLFACGVLPYYLHLLDKVKGASHFNVTGAQAKAIFKKLQEILPGYLVPRLVREEAGAKHKILK